MGIWDSKPHTICYMKPAAYGAVWADGVNLPPTNTGDTQFHSSPMQCALFCQTVSGAVAWTLDGLNTCWCKTPPNAWGPPSYVSGYRSGIMYSEGVFMTHDNLIHAQCFDGYAMRGSPNPICGDDSGNKITFPTCYPYDLCGNNNGGCDRLTSCTTNPSIYSPVCGSCPPGYDGDGYHGCYPHDFCSPNPCDPVTDCIRISGGFDCSPCPPEYHGTGQTGCIVGADYVRSLTKDDQVLAPISPISPTAAAPSWFETGPGLLSCSAVALAVIAFLAYRCLTHKRTEYNEIPSTHSESASVCI